MNVNKYIKITALIGLLISIISIVLVNTISRGNFIVGPLYSLIMVILIAIQIVIIVIIWQQQQKIKLYIVLSFVIAALILNCMMLYHYLFKMI